MGFGHDADKMAVRQRLALESWVIEARTHGDNLALSEQQVVDGLLDLQQVDIDRQVRKPGQKQLDRTRDHHLRNGRGRSNLEFLRSAAVDFADDVPKVLDSAENDVDLLEDFLRSRGRHEPSTALVEELHAQRLLRVLHQTEQSLGMKLFDKR